MAPKVSPVPKKRGRTAGPKKVKGTPEEEKKRKKARDRKKKFSKNYTTYIYKVLKQIYPGIKGEANRVGMSKKAMSIMNDMVLYILDQYIEAINTLMLGIHRRRINKRTIESATNLVLSGAGDLKKFALGEGKKYIDRNLKRLTEE